MGCDGLHGVFVELSPDTVAELESPTARRDFLLIGSPRSRRLVRYIARESALQPPGFELALGSLLAEVLAEVCRFATPHSFGKPSWLERAREYVEAHSSMRITLAELARHSGVHPVHTGASVSEPLRNECRGVCQRRPCRTRSPAACE